VRIGDKGSMDGTDVEEKNRRDARTLYEGGGWVKKSWRGLQAG